METIRTVLDDSEYPMLKRRPNPLDMTAEEADAFYAAIKQRQAVLHAKPAMVALRARVLRLTDDERRRLHEAWIKHFRMYRTAQSDLWHRCWKLYGEHWRDVLAVEETIRKAERGDLDPYEGDAWGASFAASDAARRVLLGDLVGPNEVHILTDPWNTVISDTRI